MQRSTLFVDRNVLSPHFIPDTLPHREKEIDRIMKCVAPALSGKLMHNLFIYGKTGTGKSASTKHVIDKLLKVKDKYKAAVDCIYVNCRILNTKYQIMLKCAEYCYPDESFLGFPFSHLFERVMKYIGENNCNFVVVLDEVDKVKNLDDLMYTLTRANDELKSGRISMIGISNNVQFKEQLDPRSKSALCEEEMVFAPYNAEQLGDILLQRTKMGYKPEVVSESAVSLASALAAHESGDARYALKLLLKAGELADEAGEPRIVDSHISKARKGVEEEIVYDVVKTLPEQQKIVLYAIAQLTMEGGHYTRLDGISDEKVLLSGEVYERYEGLCRTLEQEARSARWCREYMNELEMLGMITTTISGKGFRGNTTLIRLAFPPEKIIDIVRKHFE